MKKIILLGYMGSGKSLIGSYLSNKLNLPFIDLDAYIEEKEQLSIREIFETKGEIYFRKKEHFYLKDCLESDEKTIISLGGGTPCYANNHLLISNKSFSSFYLKAKVSTLANRLSCEKENRPLLKNIDDLNAFIGQHLFERVYFYNFATHKIDVDNKSVEQIAEEIILLA